MCFYTPLDPPLITLANWANMLATHYAQCLMLHDHHVYMVCNSRKSSSCIFHCAFVLAVTIGFGVFFSTLTIIIVYCMWKVRRKKKEHNKQNKPFSFKGFPYTRSDKKPPILIKKTSLTLEAEQRALVNKFTASNNCVRETKQIIPSKN